MKEEVQSAPRHFLIFDENSTSLLIKTDVTSAWKHLSVCKHFIHPQDGHWFHPQLFCQHFILNMLLFISRDHMCFVAVQSLSPVWLFVSPRTAACQASLSSLSPGTCSKSCPLSQWCHSTISSSVFHPHLLLPSILPSVWVFSSESALHIRWPKYRSFSFSISPSNEYSGQISFKID